MEKDQLIGFSNIKLSMNSKGNPRTELYLDFEKAQLMATTIGEAIAKAQETGANGIKIDLHQGKRTNQQTGHEFDTAFCFIKAKASQAVPQRVVPTGGAAVADKIQALKDKQLVTN